MRDRTCPVCNASLEGRRKDAIYCGKSCLKWAERHGLAIRKATGPISGNCERCGQRFATRDRRKRFCTEECRKRTEQERSHANAPERTCANCGKAFRRRNSKRYCSSACGDAAKVTTPCPTCGSLRTKYKPDSRYCRKACAELARRATALPRSTRRWYMGWCKHCGENFVDPQPHRDFCSPACSKRHHRKCGRQRRRNNGPSERIYRRKVYERDNWTCQLCGKPVNIRTTKPWHPLMPTLDHIIPRAAGGAHVYSNVQLAHAICNSIKSDGLYVDQPEQLRLVG